MKPKMTSRKLLGGAAAAALAALLLAPQSGWLVKTQVRMVSGVDSGGTHDFTPPARAAQAERIAAQNPDDIGLQMAAQNWKTPRPADADPDEGATERVQELGALLPRYGSQPVLHAALLRSLSQTAVNLENRPEQDLLAPSSSTYKTTQTIKNANRPENLALWEASAKAGERLDPDNAFFPLMHAVGLFAARRDDAALDALIRASRKPRYEEYLADDTQGQWRLIEEAQGEPGYIARLGVQAALRLPHFAPIRAVARLATVEAMRAEMAGDKERGFQIRMAVLRVGAKLRTNHATFIGTLVGGAIGPISWSRPGGAAPLPYISGLTKEQRDERTKENLDRYCAYLKSIGHEKETREVRWEYAAFQQSRDMWEKAEARPDNVLQLQPAQRIILLWAAGVGVLSSALLVLIWGTISTLLTRTPRIKNNFPLHPAVRAALLSTFVLPAWGAGLFMTWPELPSALLLLAGAVALCLGVIATLHRRRSIAANPTQTGTQTQVARRPVRSVRTVLNGNVGIYCATVGAAGAVLVVGLWLFGSGGISQPWFTGQSLLGADMPDTEPMGNPMMRTLLGAAISSSVSVLLGMVFAIHSRVKRVPVSVGVVRGFRRFALPAAAVLVLLYAGIAVETLREEATAKRELERCVKNGEGQYLSDLLHQPWPGSYQK